MAILEGDSTANRLTGGDPADTITGFGGNDLLTGARGADTIDGGDDNDRLRGGDGGDLITGGTGDDVLFGHGTGTDPRSGQISATLVGSFDQPLFGTGAPGGDADTLYVVERTGAIRILDVTSGITAGTFLALPADAIGLEGEQGLLGFAFDPDFANNGRAFVSLVNPDGETQIFRYTVMADDPAQLDPASQTLIWEFPRNAPYANHAGGWIGFGPDGYLYYASGDGGGPNDPDNNAQNIESNLGKMHRIDVGGADDFPDDPSRNFAVPADNPFVGTDGADTIWAYGLRNPWRPSFDSVTGDFYIADVGQGLVEEVNVQAAGAAGGQNYGWVMVEGDRPNDVDRPGNPSPDDPSLIAPVHVYDHTDANGRSVTGGYVYHGPGPGLDGFYIFGDFINGRLATFRMENGVAVDFTNLDDRVIADIGDIRRIASFAQGADGTLYVISIEGSVYRLDPSAGAADGDDVLNGGEGNDSLYGEAGFDTLDGGAGDDRAHGGFGADVIAGNAGLDRLFGDAGTDRIDGGADDDRLHGGADRDRLTGGDGADRLFGDDGDDTLNGGAGDDRAVGGLGRDIFVFGIDDGSDRIRDFETGSDRLNLRSFGFASVDEALGFASDTAAGNLVFRFDGGEMLTLLGISEATIAADIVI